MTSPTISKIESFLTEGSYAMPRRTAKYATVRKRMKPGDVIAFGGKGNFSQVIKTATRSEISHVGVILQSQLITDPEGEDRFINQIIESTSLNGTSGVQINRMSDHIATYEGEMWWLPLSDETREKLDPVKFYDFLLKQNKKKYDMMQAIGSALDRLDNVPLIGSVTHNREDFSKFFCSELVSAGLEAGGAIGSINASEVTPIDLCQFDLYANTYYQLTGKKKHIRAFSSLNPEGWGA